MNVLAKVIHYLQEEGLFGEGGGNENYRVDLISF
jgi:hypothetical protein